MANSDRHRPTSPPSPSPSQFSPSSLKSYLESTSNAQLLKSYASLARSASPGHNLTEYVRLIAPIFAIVESAVTEAIARTDKEAKIVKRELKREAKEKQLISEALIKYATLQLPAVILYPRLTMHLGQEELTVIVQFGKPNSSGNIQAASVSEFNRMLDELSDIHAPDFIRHVADKLARDLPRFPEFKYRTGIKSPDLSTSDSAWWDPQVRRRIGYSIAITTMAHAELTHKHMTILESDPRLRVTYGSIGSLYPRALFVITATNIKLLVSAINVVTQIMLEKRDADSL